MITRIVIASAVLLSASQVHAAEDSAPSNSFYLGAGVGQAYYHSDSLDDLDSFDRVSIDDNDTAYSLYAGYRFNPNVSLELGYVNLGEATAKVSGYGDVATLEADGFTASVLGRLHIANNFSVIGRLGAIQWDVDARGGGESEKDEGTDALFGGGVEYGNNQLFARAEYTRYMLDVDSGDDDEDLDIGMWSLSAGVYF